MLVFCLFLGGNRTAVGTSEKQFLKFSCNGRGPAGFRQSRLPNPPAQYKAGIVVFCRATIQIERLPKAACVPAKRERQSHVRRVTDCTGWSLLASDSAVVSCRQPSGCSNQMEYDESGRRAREAGCTASCPSPGQREPRQVGLCDRWAITRVLQRLLSRPSTCR